MFFKSGILTFIFAENNYSIRAHAMLIKTPLLHQSFGPRLSFFLFLSFSLSLYFWLIPWSAKAGCVTQGILVSFPLSLSHRQLRTTRLQSVKGPTTAAFRIWLWICLGFPGGSDGEESACNAGDLGSIPWLGRSPREGNGNPFQYSCVENSTDRGAWWAMVHGVGKNWTRLSN